MAPIFSILNYFRGSRKEGTRPRAGQNLFGRESDRGRSLSLQVSPGLVSEEVSLRLRCQEFRPPRRGPNCLDRLKEVRHVLLLEQKRCRRLRIGQPGGGRQLARLESSISVPPVSSHRRISTEDLTTRDQQDHPDHSILAVETMVRPSLEYVPRCEVAMLHSQAGQS